MSTTFQPQALTPDVSVSPQLEPSAMAEAAQAGFRSVINNRPDFEGGPSQPTSDAAPDNFNDGDYPA